MKEAEPSALTRVCQIFQGQKPLSIEEVYDHERK